MRFTKLWVHGRGIIAIFLGKLRFMRIKAKVKSILFLKAGQSTHPNSIQDFSVVTVF